MQRIQELPLRERNPWELVMLAPGVANYPYYNRLLWNFTRGIDAGEVAYAVNYNIHNSQQATISATFMLQPGRERADIMRRPPRLRSERLLNPALVPIEVALNSYVLWVNRASLPQGMPLAMERESLCDPDTSCVLPIIHGIVDARGAVAKAIVIAGALRAHTR